MKTEKEIKATLDDCKEAVKDYELSEEGADKINQGWIEALEYALSFKDVETRQCDICSKHPAISKDFRFIESIGLSGKYLVCEFCRGLNDVAIRDIYSAGIDPINFYDKIKDE